jgi:hypothetical protein
MKTVTTDMIYGRRRGDSEWKNGRWQREEQSILLTLQMSEAVNAMVMWGGGTSASVVA